MESELQKRFRDLASRAAARGIYTQTAFLTQKEQEELAALSLPIAYRLEGVFPEAERRVAVFGSEEEFGYPPEKSLALLKIAPKDEKFAVEISHRDCLGALMALGIRRDQIGDIVTVGKRAYFAVLRTMAAYCMEGIDRVGKNSVSVTEERDLPSEAEPRWEERLITAASARADAVVAAVYDLSRAEGKALFEKERVSINGAICRSPARELCGGERVSVRGFGRFYYDGAVGETRSGRCRIAVRIFL